MTRQTSSWRTNILLAGALFAAFTVATMGASLSISDAQSAIGATTPVNMLLSLTFEPATDGAGFTYFQTTIHYPPELELVEAESGLTAEAAAKNNAGFNGTPFVHDAGSRTVFVSLVDLQIIITGDLDIANLAFRVADGVTEAGDVQVTMEPAAGNPISDGTFLTDASGSNVAASALMNGTFTILKLFNAVDDTAQVNEDPPQPLIIDVLANDVDETGTVVPDAEITAVGPADGLLGPANGTAVVNNNTIEYTPNQNFFGTDEFEYSAEDQEGNADTGTVTVTVNAVNDPPVVTLTWNGADLNENDNVAANENDQPAVAYVINDIDSDTVDATLNILGMQVNLPDQGTVQGAKVSGTYTLPPIPYDTVVHPAQAVGPLPASVVADDGDGRAVTTVDFTVTVNDTDRLPSAPDVSISPLAPKTLDDVDALISTDSVDPDGDDVTYDYSWEQLNPAGPTVPGDTLSAAETAKGEDWRLTVIPQTDPYDDGVLINGPADTFDFTIANTAPDKKTPPVSAGYEYTQTALSVNVPGYEDQTVNLANLVMDPDGDIDTFALDPAVQTPDLANFDFNTDTGLVTFTPNDKGAAPEDDEYTVQFTFNVTDGSGANLPQTITVILNMVNNQLPEVVSVTPSVQGDDTQPEDPTTDEVDQAEAPTTVAFSATFSDANDPQHAEDADPFDFVTKVEWYLDGDLVKTDTPPPAAQRAPFTGNYLFTTDGYNEIVNDQTGHRPMAVVREVKAVAYDDLDGTTTVVWNLTINDVDRFAPAPAVTVTPAAPKTTEDVTATVLAEDTPVDPDGDEILGYVGEWTQLGRAVEPVDELVLSNEMTKKGEVWEVSLAAATNPYAVVPSREVVVSPNAGTAQVTIANTEPEAVPQTVAGENSVEVLEDQSVQITLEGIDPDADDGVDDLLFNAGAAANGDLTVPAKVDRTTATVTYTPADNWNGTDSFIFTVNDEADMEVRGQSDPALVEIVVIPVNDCPSFTASPNTFGLEPGAAVDTMWVTSFDPGPNEAEQGVLQYNVAVGNPGLFAVQPAVATNGTLTFELAPGADRGASTTVDVTVQDDGGTENGGCDTSEAVSFTVTVNSPPTAPVVEVTDANPADDVYTTDDLICTVVTPADDEDGINGSPIEYKYVWTDEQDERADLRDSGWTTALTDTLPSADTMRGTITCTVTARDGLMAESEAAADDILVENKPPELAVAPVIDVDTVSPETTSTFSVSNLAAVVAGRSDADEDDGVAMPDPSILYQWQKRSAGEWQDIAGETGTELAPGSLEDGDSVRLRVTAIDDQGALSDPLYSNVLTVGSAPWYPIFTLQPENGRNGLAEDQWFRVVIIDDDTGEVAVATNIYGIKMDPIEYFKAGSEGLLPGDYTVEFQHFDPAIGATSGPVYAMSISVQYDEAGNAIAADAQNDDRGQVYTFTFTTPNARGYILEIYYTEQLAGRDIDYTGMPKRVFSNVYLPNEDTGVLPVGGEQTLSVELVDQGTYFARVAGFNPLDEQDNVRIAGLFWAEFNPIVIGAPQEQNAPDEPVSGFYPDGHLIVTPNPATDLLLQWDPVPGATSYKVYLAAAGQAAILNFHDVGDATSWLLPQLPVGSYGWQVIAVNDAGMSQRSKPLVFDIVNDATVPIVRELYIDLIDRVAVPCSDTLEAVYAPESTMAATFSIMYFNNETGQFDVYDAEDIEVYDGGLTLRVPGAQFCEGDYILVQAFGEGGAMSAYKVYVIKSRVSNGMLEK